MSEQEQTSIKQQMELNHSEVIMQIQVLRDEIRPVCKVYEAMQGFGKVTFWIGKWIVTPIIVLLSVFISIKKLK